MARGAGAQGRPPPTPAKSCLDKGPRDLQGPIRKSPRPPSSHPAEGGRVRAGVLRDGTGQGSQAHGPAPALGCRGTGDDRRQRPCGWQGADGPAQPGDRGDAHPVPHLRASALPLLKGDPASPPHHPRQRHKHTRVPGRGGLALPTAQVTARGLSGPRTASVHRQPRAASSVGDPPGWQPGPARGQHLSPRQAAKASRPRDYGMARKQPGPGLPAPDSPGPRGDWHPPSPGWGSGRGFTQAWSAASKSLEARGHPSPPGSQGPGLLLAPSWTASARNMAKTFGLTGPGWPVGLGLSPSCPGLPSPLGSPLPQRWFRRAQVGLVVRALVRERWRALSLPGNSLKTQRPGTCWRPQLRPPRWSDPGKESQGGREWEWT